MTHSDPTGPGWSVIEHAPPGPVGLTEKQREEVRVAAVDSKRTLDATRLSLQRYYEAHGVEVNRLNAAEKRAKDAERQRDEARAALRSLESFLVTDKYAARENTLAMVRAALEGK